MGEKFTIVGIEHRSYISKKTGKPVDGYNFYVVQDGPFRNVDGQRAGQLWINNDLDPSGFTVGNNIAVTYNRWGQVATLDIV